MVCERAVSINGYNFRSARLTDLVGVGSVVSYVAAPICVRVDLIRSRIKK